MEIYDLITPASVVPNLRAANKRQALQELARRAAALAKLDEHKVFETLWEREQLGTTGIGGGTAVPHGRLPELSRPIALFARLEKPVDFEAIDGEPVDLVLMLMAPEFAGADHLKALARVARVLRDVTIAAKLRATHDPAALYAVLTQEPASNAA